MKTGLVVLLVGICLSPLYSYSQVYDDFNDLTINSNLWTVFVPQVAGAGASETNGYLRLRNGAELRSTQPFVNARVNGSFRFSGLGQAGLDEDYFQVIVRSSLADVGAPPENIGGLAIRFAPGSGSSQTIQLLDYFPGTVLATAYPYIGMNIFNDFLITDSGSEIKVFLGNFNNLVLSYSTITSYGDTIEFGNRVQPFFSRPPYICDVDYISIVPEPGCMTLAVVGLAVLAVRKGNTRNGKVENRTRGGLNH